MSDDVSTLLKSAAVLGRSNDRLGLEPPSRGFGRHGGAGEYTGTGGLQQCGNKINPKNILLGIRARFTSAGQI